MAHLHWKGPSKLTGDPIMSILTGIDNPSRNIKTGNVIQQWIMPENVNPIEAVKTGADEAVCGNCSLRGDGTGKGRACYVNLHYAPNQIYKQKEKLKELENHLLFNKVLRLGAWGEPCAVPIQEIARLAKHAYKTIGYTHQWRTCDPDFKKFVMASIETPEEYHLASSQGWNTFRIRKPGDKVFRTESKCPASKEVGANMTCYTCTRCVGADLSKKQISVSIEIHGIGKNHFMRREDGHNQQL